MKPKLVSNAGRVLKRSLSLRMIEAFVAITLPDLVSERGAMAADLFGFIITFAKPAGLLTLAWHST